MSLQKEVHIKCRAVSRGVAIGTVLCLYGTRRQFFRTSIADEEIQKEIDRLDSAFEAAHVAIRVDMDRSQKDERIAASEILDSHLLILDDPTIRAKLLDSIGTAKINAESAVYDVFEEFASRFRVNPDQSLRERSLDVEDVCERLLAALVPGTGPGKAEANSIIAAKEIRPSSFLEFLSSGVVGLVTETGGWTSHTSILAREAKIPAVTGIAKIAQKLRDGQRMIVDGFSGEVILEPSDSTIERYRSRGFKEPGVAPSSRVEGKPLSTIDGREIVVRTNTVSVESYAAAASDGAKGIGLFRSESLIGKFKRIPTEEEQTDAYIALADATGIEGVRIRTFDIDADQAAGTSAGRQKNPALGLRAIRLGMIHRELLIPQIRALLRASYGRDVGIIVPMVTGVSEITAIKQLVTEESEGLEASGMSIGTPAVGAMIEIPSAMMVADQLAEICDFLCLGTNDLAQYLLAADRDNESVSAWFRTLHPAMIRAVKQVIKSAVDAIKPLTVCGEMAGSPFYAPVLIGLGATELSMNPGSIESVSRVINGIAYEEACQLVSEIEGLTSADDIEALVKSTAQDKWQHLFPAGFLEMQTY